ncbi:MAG: hypothetical protein HKN23_14945 [Verrucomicrobiales bacterium]|nr:hypothetical protein [Verrucomicrobiales bacterium]
MQPLDTLLSSSDQWPRNASPPPFQVIGANEHGIVLESQREFEVGSSVAIGFHVESPDQSDKSQFISAESIVVDSRPAMKRGGAVHQVTMLFSEIDCEDRNLLLQLSGDGKSGKANPVSQSTHLN